MREAAEEGLDAATFIRRAGLDVAEAVTLTSELVARGVAVGDQTRLVERRIAERLADEQRLAQAAKQPERSPEDERAGLVVEELIRSSGLAPPDAATLAPLSRPLATRGCAPTRRACPPISTSGNWRRCSWSSRGSSGRLDRNLDLSAKVRQGTETRNHETTIWVSCIRGSVLVLKLPLFRTQPCTEVFPIRSGPPRNVRATSPSGSIDR